jgi:hypothetical protein
MLGRTVRKNCRCSFSDLGPPNGNGIDLMVVMLTDYEASLCAATEWPKTLPRRSGPGFLAHLVKPINFEQLHRILEQSLQLLNRNPSDTF